jgi:xanthine/CO dehydrogenase XdhC/CoxF family maturation factor
LGFSVSITSRVREDGSMTGAIGGGCVEAEVWNAAHFWPKLRRRRISS